MVCADSNIYIQYFRKASAEILDRFDLFLKQNQIVMSPVVLSELLTSPKLPAKLEKYLLDLPQIELASDFFVRAGYTRRAIYARGHGVTLEDIFIAQSCIDTNIPLLTNDNDMKLIAKFSDLKLA